MICIGPVCVPVWHVWMVLALIAKPVWDFLRGLCGKRRDGSSEGRSGTTSVQGGGAASLGHESERGIEITELKGRSQLLMKHRGRGVGGSTSRVFTGDFPNLLHLTSAEQLEELKKKLVARTRGSRSSGGVEGKEEEKGKEEGSEDRRQKQQQELLGAEGAPGGGDRRGVVDGFPPIVIDFSATWCRPCKAIAPFFEELAESHDGLFLKCDIDECPAVAEEFGVSALPTFCLFKYHTVEERWKKGDELIGPTRPILSEWVKKHVRRVDLFK